MGQEISKYEFTDEHRANYKSCLREETKLLKKWFDERYFEYGDVPNIGLEIEAWLIDKDYLPLPENDAFLKLADSPLLVHELSQFNFEMNVDPLQFSSGAFKTLEEQIRMEWARCYEAAKDLDGHPLLVGILPMVREDMLQLKYMSKGNRYRALNEQLFHLRGNDSEPINIEGRESLHFRSKSIMLEAAATSIQVHLQVNQENACRFMNSSMLTSAPLVALAANSPFLYGKDLWDETRIPVFEQAVNVASFRDKHGDNVGRVTFGTGYAKHSFLEFFLENLDAYPVLLPLLFDSPTEDLNHLKLQNGTIWRWNRPIVGNPKGQTPHIRIEQRVMASGPSIVDIVANTVFYLGLVHHFAELEKAPEESLTFTDCKNNFYTAARDGFRAKINWFGKSVNVQDLLVNELIPAARKSLINKGFDVAEVDYYMSEVIHQRALSGQNGAAWQRSFVDCHGLDFQAMTQAYLENQMSEKPVHKWRV